MLTFVILGASVCQKRILNALRVACQSFVGFVGNFCDECPFFATVVDDDGHGRTCLTTLGFLNVSTTDYCGSMDWSEKKL